MGMINADATSRMTDAAFTGDCKEIAASFFRLGATSYGGPAMMGIMQAELQEKRKWVSKERFLEGLAVANVLGLFGVAVYRLGRSAASTVPEAVIAVMAAAALIGTPLGIVAILLLAGAAGLLLFHVGKPRSGVVVLASVIFLAVLSASWWVTTSAPASGAGRIPNRQSLVEIGIYFLKVGAFTIGGGFTMIAFIQNQVVGQFGWLTPREFIDGLALGQLTPGPLLTIAAYVGYKVAGAAGAAVAATAAFLPSFVIGYCVSI
jgi:chromate transporter